MEYGDGGVTPTQIHVHSVRRGTYAFGLQTDDVIISGETGRFHRSIYLFLRAAHVINLVSTNTRSSGKDENSRFRHVLAPFRVHGEHTIRRFQMETDAAGTNGERSAQSARNRANL